MNMKKIFVTGILIFCLLGIVNGEFAEIRIDSVTWDPSHIEAGDNVRVYVKFHRHPSGKAFLTPPPKGEDVGIFYIARLEPADELTEKNIIIKRDTKNVGHLFVGESWTTPFDIKVKENAIAMSYKMRFSIIETDVEGVEIDTVKFLDFEIPVKGIVKFDVDSNNTLKLGRVGDINITITNEGGGDAKHVTVKLDLSDPFTPVRASEEYVGDFEGGERKDVTFKVSVDSKAEPKAYKIPLTIKYIDADGTEKEVGKDIGVQIDATPDLTIALESADTFTRGSTGKVSIEVVNEGFIDAKFVKLTLEPTDDYEVTSINEFYIGNLDSDDVETEDFTIKISDSVDKEIIPLKVKLEYRGEGNNIGYTKEDTVNIKILSEEDYATRLQENKTSSMIIWILIAIPVIFISLLVLWFIYKLFTLVTGYINRKLFSR